MLTRVKIYNGDILVIRTGSFSKRNDLFKDGSYLHLLDNDYQHDFIILRIIYPEIILSCSRQGFPYKTAINCSFPVTQIEKINLYAEVLICFPL